MPDESTAVLTAVRFCSMYFCMLLSRLGGFLLITNFSHSRDSRAVTRAEIDAAPPSSHQIAIVPNREMGPTVLASPPKSLGVPRCDLTK